MLCFRLRCFRAIRRQFILMNSQTVNVLQLGTAFFFIFFAFNSASFIEETVISALSSKGEIGAHAGYNSLAIIYAFFTFCNFLAAPIVYKIGTKWSLVAGGLAYALFQAGFLFLNEPYLYLSSAVLGLGAAVIWTAQGQYLTMNSNENTAGKHSGLFWAMSQACLACGGVFLFVVFNSGSPEINDSKVHFIYGVFVSVTLVGIGVLALLRMPSTVDDSIETCPTLPLPSEPQLTQIQLLKSTIRLCLTKRMLLLILVFMYTGISLSFWSGIYPSCIGFSERLGTNTKAIVGLNAITQGLGQAAGGFIFGILSSKTSRIGRDKIVFIGAVVSFIAFSLIFISFPNDAPQHPTSELGFIQPSVPLTLLAGYLLGFGDACFNTQVFAILIARYPSQSAQAFSLFKFFQSLLTCAAFFYGSVINLSTQLIMLIVGAIIATISFAFADNSDTLASISDESVVTSDQ